MLWGAPAGAHKVTVFAWVEGTTIHTQSKFSGGKVVKGGRIDILDEAGEVLLTGLTDDQGAFSFPIPQTTDLKVVLTAGSGHGNYWIVSAAEIGAMPDEGSANAREAAEEDQQQPPQDMSGIAAAAQGPCPNMEELEALVARSVESKLAPLRAQLADPEWGLRDILGGIGYILGLMGLAAYIHSRRHHKVSP
jgi:nickel transport protein